MELRGTTALITGGSRGLGRALGHALAARGVQVVLVARQAEPLHSGSHVSLGPDAGEARGERGPEGLSGSMRVSGALEEVVAEIRARGGTAHGIVADVGDKDAIHAIAGQAAALVGPIDILINNASTLGPVPLRLLLDTECEDLERVLAVNLLGPFRLTKVLAGSMLLRSRGVVVNVSSDAAVEAYARWGAYGTSKAALDHLGRIWAAELADTGVRVLTIDPGEMNTRMHAEAMPEADPASLADPARVAERIVALIRDEQRAPSGARLAAQAPAAGGAS
jgi:NAD(P)-dependent dehydrogenase (short-subunit alcohol dehydrogenase family)